MNKESFIKAIHNLGFILTDTQIEQFESYRRFLQQENQKINLTALISDADIYEKHFYDCCLILDLLDDIKTFCDVGSGAGFPGLVIAIMRPDIEVTLLEPTKKRANFLKSCVSLLGLNNVIVTNKRAEDFHEKRGFFDCLSARAVSNLPMLLELCIPLLKTKGIFIAMKGSQAMMEVEEARTALETLFSSVESAHVEHLFDGSERINLKIIKNKETPKKYPRTYGQIKKRPL